MYSQGQTPTGSTIPVDTDWTRKEAGPAFQVERTKPQTPRATPPPQTHTTTKFYGRPQCPMFYTRRRGVYVVQCLTVDDKDGQSREDQPADP